MRGSIPPPFGDYKARTLAARTSNHSACSGRRNDRAGKAEDNEIHPVQQDRYHVDRGCPGEGINATSLGVRNGL
ncbi:hypothetical protein [Rhodococcus erythropolis]|uniref:Uncharacterized protein n=1 Tax=Rhodococcus erythropolis TaxID=1833 RepID=A0A8I0ZZI0_RHOER|nr:hypothetical protein [Rhodococcus erythropolis]MBH5144326.1 hypothetical protein [Rhodococcus erythropolis]